VTRTAANWQDDTAGSETLDEVSIIHAGRFDAQTAYAAINTLRSTCGAHLPYARRQDVDAIAAASRPARGRCGAGDPKRKGLPSPGRNVKYVSFDDGERCGVAAAEHAGNVNPRLHQERRRPSPARTGAVSDSRRHPPQADGAEAARADAVLLATGRVSRHQNTNTDTPIPPDEPGEPA
jgi:hypothetical protein